MEAGLLRLFSSGLDQKKSKVDAPDLTSMRSGNVLTDCQNNYGTNLMAFHRENGSSVVVEERTNTAAKRKRESRIKGGGLRQLSVIVCQKLESKVRTTYSEVADEIVAEYAGTDSDTTASSESDEKNIRRRVYDALNVLLALDIIARDKKDIHWKGLPSTNVQDLEKIKALHVRLINGIRKKVTYLKDLEEQIVGLQNLMMRNRQLLERGISSPGGFPLPFILVQTSPHATVEIEISENMKAVHCDFNSTPFSLHDDAYILKLMRHYQRLGSRGVSQNSSGH